jgi:glycerol-3-phosphate dehydrogenase
MLFVDAREAKRVARRVAELMAEELGRDEQWIDTQVSEFEALADRYVYQPK